LKKFAEIEEQIDKLVERSHKIGAMELKTSNICEGFKKWA